MTEPGSDPQPLPVSQPPAGPAPVPRAQRNRFGAAGALLCLGAAVLTAIGSFQAMYAVQIEYPGGRQSQVFTSWDFESTTNGVPDPVTDDFGAPLYGVPLMFGVAVLLATAVLGMLVAATPSGSSRFGLAYRMAAVIAAVFLVATVWSVGMQVLWLDTLGPPDQSGTAKQIGAGFWSLVAGAVLAVVAAVVAWRSARVDVREREEPDTPVLGIPVVVHRLPDAPPDRPSGE